MKPGDGKRRRVLSAEERVLWTAITKSIAPLRDSDTPEDVETAEHVIPQIDIPSAKKARPAEPAANRRPPPLAPLGRRTRTRVARGKEAIDGRLDLHGLTQSEAHPALLRFLHMATPPVAPVTNISPWSGVTPALTSASTHNAAV